VKVWLKRGQPARDDEVLAVLQGELELLREENARLQAERGLPLDPGRLSGDARALVTAAEQADSAGDEAWHVLTEALVMREALLDVCQGVELAMVSLGDRLRTLAPSAALALDSSCADGDQGHSHGNGRLAAA